MSLAIDDFGTGYSSLTYLKRFPFDQVKIDRSFVTHMLSDSGDAAIVAAVLGLAQTLGLSTVAEGVSDAAQLAELGRLGCDFVQGYYFSPPTDVDTLRRALSASGAGAPSRGTTASARPLRLADQPARAAVTPSSAAMNSAAGTGKENIG